MANLRVDPARLMSAAAAEREIGTTVGSLAAGDTLHGAAAGVSQLSTGAAMAAAAAAVDQVGTAVSRETMAHAGKLSTDLLRSAGTSSLGVRDLRFFLTSTGCSTGSV